MNDRLMAILVLAVLAAFLGIMAWWVPRLDLGAVIVVTYLLAVYDLLYTSAHPQGS